MKIINPLSPNGTKEDIKTVLRVLAGQGGCDGEPYDQMQAAADYIAELEAECRNTYSTGITVGEKERLRLGGRILELEATVEKLKCCDNCNNYEPHCITNEKKCAIDNQYRNRTHKCDKWEAK